MVGVDAKTERKVCLRVTHEVERQQRELELRRELGACPFLVEVTPATVDAHWWRQLLDSRLAWYPFDDGTGFRLDAPAP